MTATRSRTQRQQQPQQTTNGFQQLQQEYQQPQFQNYGQQGVHFIQTSNEDVNQIQQLASQLIDELVQQKGQVQDQEVQSLYSLSTKRILDGVMLAVKAASW